MVQAVDGVDGHVDRAQLAGRQRTRLQQGVHHARQDLSRTHTDPALITPTGTTSGHVSLSRVPVTVE